MNQCQHCGGWGASHRPECPTVTGWAPADIKSRYDSTAWVSGWARRDEYEAGAKYVSVRHIGSLPGQRLPRARIVFK